MEAPNNRVLLIHGIWNHSAWLQPLASKLKLAGFDPSIFSYDSILLGAEASMPALLDTIQRTAPSYLVGHSLGGVMALNTLKWAPGLPVHRAVCLGSPLQGSFTARHMAAHPLLRYVLGRSQGALTAGLTEWEGSTQVGMVAGNVSRGLGRLVAPLRGENDGTVLVSETKLPGLAAHCLVACGHTELALAESPAKRVVQFLRTGGFGE